MHFFGWVAGILFILSLLLFVPVFIDYVDTGLVPRFPTFIASAVLMVMTLLSLSSGLILDTNAKNSRKNFEIQMDIIRMMLKHE